MYTINANTDWSWLWVFIYAVYSALGRSGLILISFSTVSCCPLQFSAVCTWSSIFKLYLVHIFNFVSACYMCICLIHIGQKWIHLYPLAPSLAAFCWCIRYILCMIELNKSLSASMSLVKYFYLVIHVYEHVSFALKCYR